ncbi:hypothetical protein P9H19_20075, partial [Bacillus licheniformis]
FLRMGAAGSDMLRGCIGYLLPDAHGSRQTNFTRQFLNRYCEISRPLWWIKQPATSAPKKKARKSRSKKVPIPPGIYKSLIMKGTAVRQIQEALAALYFYPDKGAKNNGIDVYYGTKTKAQLESLLV